MIQERNQYGLIGDIGNNEDKKNIRNHELFKGIKRLKGTINNYILVLIILSIIAAPSTAISPHDVPGGIPENQTCIDCHTTHLTIKIPSGSSRISQMNSFPVSETNIIQSFEASSVTGNITLISSVSQNWYQQGIKGPDNYGTDINDNSWGWTFFDEVPPSGFMFPPNITQRENISALLLDDGNNSSPISGAIVIANVTYWTYDNVSYSNHTVPVQLLEDPDRKGFYSGRFDFYGGTNYKGYDMRSCDGCHTSIYGSTDNQAGYFPGNYTVSIRAQADGKIKNAELNFDVTAWGCEDCHGSGNRHRASADMDSACYICHGINSMAAMSDAGNPHQIQAHVTIQCTDCHTNKSINAQTFDGVTFGGLNGNRPQYKNETIQLSGGKHSAVSCTDCHNSLTLPEPHGGFGNYNLNGTINDFYPDFASLEQFEDYYVIT